MAQSFAPPPPHHAHDPNVPGNVPLDPDLSFHDPDSTTDIAVDPALEPASAATTNQDADKSSTPIRDDFNPPVSPRTTVRLLKHYCSDVLTNSDIFRRAGVSRRNGYRYLADSGEKRKKAKRTGRPPKLAKDSVVRLIEDVIAGAAGIEPATWDEMRDEFQLECCAATLRRRLTEAGYLKCQTCQRGYLSAPEIRMRREYAAAYALWDSAAWEDLYFHHEHHFTIDRRDNSLHLCAGKDRVCVPCSATPSVSRRGYRGFHVWGMVGREYRSPLIFFNEGEGEDNNTMTAAQFYELIFRPIIEQRLQIADQAQKPFVVFEEADATCAQAVGLKVHKNSPRSPDFNIMRGVWTIFRERCSKRKCASRQELKMVMVQEWGMLPMPEINEAIRSLPQRMAQCTERGGLMSKWAGVS